jgi:sugar transferase (PEP-CTERM system associated)
MTRARHFASFTFEAGVVFSTVYGLALLTASLVKIDNVPADSRLAVLLTGSLFVAILLATQSAAFGAGATPRQEIIVFYALSLVGATILSGTLLIQSSDRKLLPMLLSMEGGVVVPLAIALWRQLSLRLEVLDATRENVLIVGVGETSRQLARWIGENRPHVYAVLGFAAETRTEQGALVAMGARIQTDYASLPRYAGSRAQRVVVALDEKRGKLPVKELMELRLLGVEIEDVTTFYERESGRISVETMLPSWLIFSDGFKTSPLRSVIKRFSDIVNALILLVVTAPIMVLTAILIKLDSKGPVFYRQNRLGRFGEEYAVLKFRSMRIDAEHKTGPTWAQNDDPRVTRVGRVIRKLRIDEVPQLFNVLRGQMSFVGPRPERAHFVRQLETKIPYYGLRMTVRPGITGWAQVEYGYGATEDDALEKLKYDLFYVKNNNVFFDFWIVLKTIRVVLSGHGAR